jgi:hypothetical protein
MRSNPQDSILQLFKPLTQPVRDQIPPYIQIAAGYEEEVYLIINRIDNPEKAAHVLMKYLLVRELDTVIKKLGCLTGLIYKKFPVEQAKKIRDQFEQAGGEVTFLTPDSVEKYFSNDC